MATAFRILGNVTQATGVYDADVASLMKQLLEAVVGAFMAYPGKSSGFVIFSPRYHCQETLSAVMLSASARVAVTGKPTRGCRVERVTIPCFLYIGDLYRHLLLVRVALESVTFTVTSYTLFPPESPGDS